MEPFCWLRGILLAYRITTVFSDMVGTAYSQYLITSAAAWNGSFYRHVVVMFNVVIDGADAILECDLPGHVPNIG